MYYSKLKDAVNFSTVLKVLVALVAVLLVWQHFDARASTGKITSEDLLKLQTAPTTQPVTPVKVDLRELYRQASFLEVVPTGEKVSYNKTDLFCLAKNIYHEASGESRLGKFAVAQVTLNRMKHPEFKNTVCGVVFERNQFSWANNGRLRWTRPSNEAWRESVEIAEQALKKGFRVKGMETAIFYHADYVRPGWRGVKRLTKIGAHIFYREV